MTLTRTQVMRDFMVDAHSRKPSEFEWGDLWRAS